MPTAIADTWREGRLGKRAESPAVVFGRVQEDANAELHALLTLPPGQGVFCIGSGGCTAFALLLGQPGLLHVVDVNSAQIALIDLKRAAITALPQLQAVEAITQRATHWYPRLRPLLNPEHAAFWDGNQHLLTHGIERAGMIERAMRRGRAVFQALVHSRQEIEGLLNAPDLEAQRHAYASQWDSWRWRGFLRIALSRFLLNRIYGGRFVEPLPDDFGAYVRQKLDSALVRTPAKENGHLWQALLGRYPDRTAGLPPFLQPDNYPRVVAGLPALRLTTAEAASYLLQQPAGSVGFFALSNILEVSTEDDVQRLVHAVTHAAQPGALVCLRWILPPPAHHLAVLGSAWSEDTVLTQQITELDSSLFCRDIRVYRA